MFQILMADKFHIKQTCFKHIVDDLFSNVHEPGKRKRRRKQIYKRRPGILRTKQLLLSKQTRLSENTASRCTCSMTSSFCEYLSFCLIRNREPLSFRACYHIFPNQIRKRHCQLSHLSCYNRKYIEKSAIVKL